MSPDEKKLIAAMAGELSTMVGAMIDAPVKAGPGAMSERAWRLRIALSTSATIDLAFDEAGARALTMAVSRQTGEPAASAIAEMLHELCAQIIGAAAFSAHSRSDEPEIAKAELTDWNAPDDHQVVTLSADALQAPLSIAMVVRLGALSTPDGPRASAATDIEPTAEERLDVILDIDLPLVVRFGCTDMPLKALARLGPGSLIDLGRSPDDPVEVLVGNRVVARGEVVIVSGSYGIRILDVVSPRERIHGLSA